MSLRPSRLAVVGAVLIGLVAAVAVLAPFVAPYDPRAFAGESLQPPSSRHLLGTNNLGQDVLSQIVWGARASLTVALAAAALAVVLGSVIGASAGVIGGTVDSVVMRLVDVALAIPRLPLLVLVAALTGASRTSVALVIGLLTWPVVARLVRSQTLTLRARGFVHAARGFGGGVPYLVRRHLLPGVGPILVATFVAISANAVLLEASLAFLGLSDPGGISWGLILNRALLHPGLYFTSAWLWWVLPAGFAITLAVLGFTFLGVGLEPMLNPRWRRAGSR